MVKMMVASVAMILVGFLCERSLGSSAIDPKGNPIPESPAPAGGSPGPSPSTVTLSSILLPSSGSVGNNDTHCDNTVNDNDNITVPNNPASPLPPAPLSSTLPPAQQPSSSAPIAIVSSSPAPVSAVTEAVTHASSSPQDVSTPTSIGNANLPSSSTSPPATSSTQRPREGKNIADSTTNSSSTATAEIPRGQYLPPKNA